MNLERFAFIPNLHLLPYFVFASIKGTDETVRIYILVRAFDARRYPE